MKTVAPVWNNEDTAWKRLVEIAKGFPSRAQLVTNRDFCGAAIGGQTLNARWTFVQRTIEVESKAALLTGQERGPVRLLLCSAENGTKTIWKILLISTGRALFVMTIGRKMLSRATWRRGRCRSMEFFLAFVIWNAVTKRLKLAIFSSM